MFCKLSFCRTYSPLNLTTFVQPSTGQKLTPSISLENAHICFIPISLDSGELYYDYIISRISLLKKRAIFYIVPGAYDKTHGLRLGMYLDKYIHIREVFQKNKIQNVNFFQIGLYPHPPAPLEM